MKDRDSLVRLRNVLSERFNVNELQVIFFDLGLDYDDLPGQSKEAKLVALLNYLERRDRLLQLLEVVRKSRPDIANAEWGRLFGLNEELDKPARVPSFHDLLSYSKRATSRTPALVLFVIDVGYHMKRTVGDVAAIELVNNALRAVLTRMVGLSSMPTVITPRYHVGIITYGGAIRDMIDGIQPTTTINSWGDIRLKAHSEPGEAYAGLAHVERILKRHVENYIDCPAPLICHITAGEYRGRNPEPIADRIKSLLVRDGNVLLENILIDDEAILTQSTDFESWLGIRDENELAMSFARQLFRMSSVIPESYRALSHESGYFLGAGSRMLYPGTRPQLLSLGLAIPALTSISF